MILTIHFKRAEVILLSVGMVEFFAGDEHYKKKFGKGEEHKKAYLIVSCPNGAYKLTFKEDEHAQEAYKRLKTAIFAKEEEVGITPLNMEFWRR